MFDSGVVSVHDVDSGDGHFQNPASLAGTYGSFTFNSTSGAWTYQADPAKVQSLGPNSTVTDTLTVTSFDGTAHANIVVTIAGVNDAPVYLGNDLAPTYHVHDSPVALVGSNITVSDIDSANYAGGTLTATVIDGSHPGDTLSIVGNPHISLLEIASGTTVMYDSDGVGGDDPVAIGTLSSYYNSLTVALNAHAGDAAVAALTQAIKFSNSTENPAADIRTVAFTLHDGGGTANNGQDSDYFEAHVTVPTSAAPVIQTDQFTVSDGDNGVTTVSGLYVTDTDASVQVNHRFTLLATTGAPAPAQSSVDPSSGSGYLGDINETLSNGVTYDPGEVNQPLTDSVTVSVGDGLGHSDTVHFIFNQAGEAGVRLTGTDDKDVLFATGHTDDILTGGANADQFVFKVGDGNDTITDFTPGQDHIDLRLFSASVDASNIVDWLGEHAHSQNNGDMVLSLGGEDSITLKHVASLSANDFILHPGNSA
jgi:VCBS repeat-containing protein